MKKHQNYLCNCVIILLINFISYSQNNNVKITARVDTTKNEIKKIYNLFNNYLNSKPDSIYNNPNWNEKVRANFINVDRSANQLFLYSKSKEYFNYYKPKILQIDSVDLKRYQIKTMYLANCSEPEYEKFNPEFITKHYAVNHNGIYKLENCIHYDTKNWKTKKFKFITYFIHPKVKYNYKEAKNAYKFCKKISSQFNIEILPFKYYVLPNSDELGRLYNFEYWMSYLNGQTNIPLREIYTTNSNFNFQHELIHIIFPLPKNKNEFCPMIINEGIATWLGGLNSVKDFENELKNISILFNKKEKITFEEIINFKYRNEFNNSILYVTGAVICKLVHQKKGKEGLLKLYNSNLNNYKFILEELFETNYLDIEKTVIEYIKNYSKK